MSAEDRPGSPAPQSPEPLTPVSFPAIVSNGDLFVHTALQEEGTLAFEVQREEQVLFAGALAPDNRLRLAAVVQPHPTGTPGSSSAPATQGELSVETTKREDGTHILRVQRDGAVLFDAAVTSTNLLRLVFDATTMRTQPIPELAHQTPAPGPVPQSEGASPAPATETEKPRTIKVWGNLSRVFTQTAQRATFLFAEHPDKDEGSEPQYQSFYHTLSDEEKAKYRYIDGTVFHTVLATKERVALLEAAATTDQSVLTCFPHTWQEPQESGRKKTVHGFVLVNWEPMETYKPKEQKRRKDQPYPAGTPPLLPES